MTKQQIATKCQSSLRISYGILEKQLKELGKLEDKCTRETEAAIEATLESLEAHTANIEVAAESDDEEYEAHKNDAGYWNG